MDGVVKSPRTDGKARASLSEVYLHSLCDFYAFLKTKSHADTSCSVKRIQSAATFDYIR